jgi:beta-xylosidase
MIAGGRRSVPVWSGYLADPFAWRSADGAWYAVGTGAAEAAGEAGASRIFPMLRSRDFARWELLPDALDPPGVEQGPDWWAPAAAEVDGRHYLYYSVGDSAIPRHQLRVAVSDEPGGPYRDHAALTDTERMPFAIDPHPFLDVDGSWWLFYARDFLDREGDAHAGTALVADRLIGMTRLAGKERVILRARHDWTLFAAKRTMYGRVWDWHTLEGPCVVHRHGRYWCLYSGACWGNASYGLDYAVSDYVDGPYSDAGSEAGPRLLRTTPGVVSGPGHATIVVGPDGGDYLAYHAWDERGEVRSMRLDRLTWTREGPRCDIGGG